MARPSKVDACMFCGNAPCTCNEKAKAELKPRKPRKPAAPKVTDGAPKVDPVEKADPVSIHDAMRAASKVKAPLPEDVAESLNDMVMVQAIQNLAPLLGEAELLKWKPVLEKKVEPRDRATAWRARRDVGQS